MCANVQRGVVDDSHWTEENMCTRNQIKYRYNNCDMKVGKGATGKIKWAWGYRIQREMQGVGYGSHWTEHCTSANVQSGVGEGSHWTEHEKCASNQIIIFARNVTYRGGWGMHLFK